MIKRDLHGRFVKQSLPDIHCIDCQKKLISRKALRCKSCNNIYYNKLGLRGMKNKHQTQRFKDIMKQKMTNREIKAETKEKISKTLKEKKIAPPKEFWFKNGSKPYNYKGTSSINKLIRCSFELKIFREKVFIRDNYTCQKCGKKGCYIEGHHIITIKECLLTNNKEQIFNVDNGMTLCRPCHMKIHNWKIKNIFNGE